ncbi:MAG: FecR family protein [Treponema sp.]|nr:FecR family protein [Treponema sp.]
MSFLRHLLCFLLIALYSLSSIYAQSADFGIIRDLIGTVELKTSEDAPFIPANILDQVWNDTIVSTDFRSSALIELGSIVIVVRPLTRMTFTEILTSEGNEVLNINLQAGRIRVDIDAPAGTRTSLDVVSPMAVASVRGTSFEFDTKTLSVSSGFVNFRGSAGQVVSVSAGFSTTPAESGRVWNPVTVGSSGHRPSPPSGVQPSSNPAPLGVRISGSPDSGPPGQTPRPPSSPSSPSGPTTGGEVDTSFDFLW